MKYTVKHYESGFQVFENDGGTEILIASFHKEPRTRVGEKSSAQIRAEEYCEFLNQKDSEEGFHLDLEED